LERNGRAILDFYIEISKGKSSFFGPNFELKVDVVNAEFTLDQLVWLRLQAFAISDYIDVKISILAFHSKLVVDSALGKLP